MRLQDLLQDARYSIRSMRRSPGSTTVQIVLIAVSIGLACSAFAVTDAVLFRSLPAIAEPDRLVLVSGVSANNNRVGHPLRVYEYLAGMREGTSHIFAYRNYGALPGTIGTTTTPLRGIGIFGDYFGGLGGVPLVMGRTFEINSDEPVAVISYGAWQNHFGGAPDVLGRTVVLGSTSLSVVGVAHSDFVGTQPDLPWDLITPLNVLNRARGVPPAALRNEIVYPVARLAEGSSAAQYQARIDAAWASILRETVPVGMTLEEWTTRRGSHLVAESLRTGQAFTLITTPGLPRALNLTLGLALLTFLAGCVTLALLAVARAVRKHRDNTIRLALGGSRWRVVRPYVVESALISLVGCGGGLLIAMWGTEMGRSFLPGEWPVVLTPSAIAIALAMAAATTIVAGGLATYLSSKGSARDTLQHGNRASQPHVRLRVALLVTQFAVSIILVYSTLLYVDDLARLNRVDIGVNPDNLRVYTLAGRLPQRPLGSEYFQRLVSELEAIPNAESVGLSGGAPPLGFIRDLTEPMQAEDGRSTNGVMSCVFPGAFASWGARQVAGRDLDWSDGPSAVVTESLARRLYPGQSPLGRSIHRKTPGLAELEIVGVVGDMAYNGPRLGPRDVAFVSCLERTKPWPSNFGVNIFIRSSRSLAEVGRDVRAVLDREAVHYVYVMDDQEQFVAWSMEREHMLATLSGAFGGLIVLLTGVGLYAFCNYMLAFRNRELAIRAGLGAAPYDIAAALLRETLTVLVVGVSAGLATTLLLTRILAGFVVDSGSMTVRHALQATFILVIVTGVASSLPTLRALRIDLARALRVD